MSETGDQNDQIAELRAKSPMVCFVDVLRGPRFIRRDGLTRLIVDVCDVMKSVANGSTVPVL